MKFLIDLLKKSSKGDYLRANETPDKYNDKISQLNVTANNQFSRLNTVTINKIQKTNASLTQNSSGNSQVPGK
jgi:hypothetical protein